MGAHDGGGWGFEAFDIGCLEGGGDSRNIPYHNLRIGFLDECALQCRAVIGGDIDPSLRDAGVWFEDRLRDGLAVEMGTDLIEVRAAFRVTLL